MLCIIPQSKTTSSLNLILLSQPPSHIPMASSIPKPSSFSSVIEHNISIPTTTSHARHHRRCLTCFCFLFLVLLIVVFLFTLFAISFRSSLLPFIPSFHLHHLNTSLISLIPIYDGNGDAYVTVSADIVIVIWNGNPDANIRYDESSVLLLAEGDELRFEEVAVPAFRQAGRSLKRLRVTAVVTESQLIGKYVRAMEKGEMVMDVEWRMRVSFVADGEFFERVPLSVLCEGVNMLKHPTKCTANLYGRFSFN